MVNKKQQILRINKIIIFLLIFSFCGGGSETSETVEEVQDTTTTTEVQDTSTFGSWANVKGPPMIYAASDVSQSTIDKTLKWYEIASSAWGEFGPAEIWIVGNSKETVSYLEDLWCDIRTEKDKKWNKENVSINFFLEILNLLAQKIPTPNEYGLERDNYGNILTPYNLIEVDVNRESIIPSFGFSIDF